MQFPATLRRQAKRLPFVDRWRDYRAGCRRVPFIKRYLPKGGIGAEIGVYKGHFSPFLLRHSEARKLHLIDSWYLQGEQWPWASGSRSTAKALAHIIRANSTHLASGRLVLNIGDDLEILPTFPVEYFDWVYLDTTHAYLHTQMELALLKTVVKPGGVIAGDDWHSDPQHRHQGVCRAVREFTEREGFEILYYSDQDLQWAISATP